MKVVYALLALAALAVAALALLRLLDWRAERAEWQRLAAAQPVDPARFDRAMTAGLPDPARRFFDYAIAPGTPLWTLAEIDMGGRFGLGSAAAPDYRPMRATQILASPSGFVWRLRLPGGVPVSGSDSGHWTRFRILGLIPVARLGGDPDHARSAFGRLVAESIFWTPAAVLPGPGVAWQPIDAGRARVTVSRGDLSQAVDLAIAADGRPLSVSLLRWSDANAERRYRLQAFGGTLADFREVDGFRLPFRVEAGNHFGSDDYFAFYRAEVVAIRFPRAGGRARCSD